MIQRDEKIYRFDITLGNLHSTIINPSISSNKINQYLVRFEIVYQRWWEFNYHELIDVLTVNQKPCN